MDVKSLLDAAFADDGELVARHLEVGLAPNYNVPEPDGGKVTLLHLLAHKGCVNAIEALLKGGADPDSLDSENETPIKSAIIGHHLGVVNLLLNYGANIGHRMKYGDTPLHVALLADEVSIAQLLIDLGADGDAKNDRGIRPRDIAQFKLLKSSGFLRK